jgi:hypothetical protein
MSAPQSLTSRFPNGVTNATDYQTMAAAGIPDPSWAHVYHNDFDTFAAGDWTITKTGTGTVALAAGDGGQLLLTNTTGAADAIYMQLVAAGFKLVAGKDVFFKFAGTLSAVVNDVFYAGLLATTTTPGSTQDAVYINKPTGSAALQLVTVIGGVSTTVAFPAAAIPVAGTAFEVGFHIDYLGNVEAFFNPTTGADWQQLNPTSSSAGAMTARGAVVRSQAPSLTTANLNVSFGLLNSTGVANTLSVDYVTAVRNR